LFEAGLRVRLDCVNRAFRFANAAIDAFVGVNDKHVLTLIEAVHRTHLDTVHVLAANAALIDDVGQSSLLPAVAYSRRLHRILLCTHSRSMTSSKDVRRVTRVATSV